GQTDVFWYSFRTSKGTNYYRVDARKGTKEALFDQDKLAALLSELSHKPVEPVALTTQLMRNVSVTADGTKMRFASGEYQYEYDLKSEKLTKGDLAAPEQQAD